MEKDDLALVLDTAAAALPADVAARAAAKRRLDSLAMPHWALGALMDLALELAGIRGTERPDCARRVTAVCAGDHAVALEGVTDYPQSITGMMMNGIAEGGAGVNALGLASGTDVALADFGVLEVPPAVAAWDRFRSYSVGRGTASIARGPAMTRAAAIASVANGIRFGNELIDAGYGAIAPGEVGIGNSTAAAAVIAALTGRPAAEVTGRGTGRTDAQLADKIRIVERALEVNRPDRRDAFDVLAKTGGFEIGGMAGLFLAGAARRTVMVVDGFIASSAALLAATLSPTARDSMIASHLSAEKGHRVAMAALGKKPYFDLSLRLGEGTGATVMMNLIASATSIMAHMHTFDDLHT